MSKNFLRFPSPAKLNLFLHIVGRRSDGYHELQTLFQFLDYGDTIDIKVNETGTISLLTPIEGVKESDNLIVKAAILLRNESATHLALELGVEIKINKILPMGGGLGGGSSNAATVLMALNVLWDINLSTEKLANLGLTLGADVPIFIHGFAAFAEGVGEKLQTVTPKEYWYLISKPNCSISTASVFSSDDLPRSTPRIRFDEIDIEQCHNDCQTMVIKNYPEVANLLSWLVKYAPTRMTGTGACIFSRFNSEVEAKNIQLKLPKGVTSFVAKGLNKSTLITAISRLSKN